MSKVHIRRFIFIAVAAAILVTAGISYGKIHENREDQNRFKSLKGFSEICLQKFPANTHAEKIKNLRHCLFVNTKFSVDKNMTPLWDDKAMMADWLFDYASKTRSDPPPMECSYRSGTLVTMLESQGYEAHDIVITRNEDDFNDHVVVEVLNPDTGAWEVHDPSYDIDFVTIQDKKPLGIKDMLVKDTSEYTACNYAGKCTWDQKTSEGFQLQYNRGYWNTAWIKEDKVLYISKRFNETEKRSVYGEQKSYCEFRAKWCNNVVYLK